MKRYSDDYGSGLYYCHHTARWLPTKRRPLARAEAARVIAEPLPKRTTHVLRPIAWASVIGWWVVAIAWCVAWIVAFAL